MEYECYQDGNLSVGLVWGTILSVPLWVSFFGWGGRFDAVSSKVYKNTVTDFNPYSNRYEAEYSLTRWFDDIQSDFAARADWLTAESYEDANHNPAVEVEEGLDLTVEKGGKK